MSPRSNFEHLKGEELPKEVPKPFTVPEGYVHPTLKEQFTYAARRHPYSRYGYGLVFLVGLGLYTAATVTKVEQVSEESRRKKAGDKDR